MNSALRANSINDPNFMLLQSLYQACDTGLQNVPPFVGITYRGISYLWNPFTVGSTVPLYSYLSTSNPKSSFYSQTYKFDITGTTSRDIASLSQYTSENEHLFPRGENEFVDSRSGNKFQTHMVPKNYCTT
jgi:hypothetical protein